MSRSLLAFACLLLGACGSLPKVPRHVQYGVHADVNPPGFYGVDNVTHEHHFSPFNDPLMKGGQCLTATDYKAWAKWIDEVKQIAETRCH